MATLNRDDSLQLELKVGENSHAFDILKAKGLDPAEGLFAVQGLPNRL